MITKEEKIQYYVRHFNCDDEETKIQAIDNAHAAEWMLENIPHFECPDPELEEIYYFRWWVYRKHIKRTPEGFIITEFHPDVPWAGPYNSINCAVGHHTAEGRWLKNSRRYLADNFRFWLKKSGNVQSYSCWIAWSLMQYCETVGDDSLGIELIDDLVSFYEKRQQTNLHANGLFWSDDDRDAMEMSISGSGFRPTLNSYMAGNAKAIAYFAQKAGRAELQERFAQKAEQLSRLINEKLWDAQDGFFKCIPTDGPEAENPVMNLENIPVEHNAMEEIGMIPWYFELAQADKDCAWRYVTDEKHLKAPYGPATADRSHPRFMFSFPEHECLWNGPSWPFATSQTLVGAANLLGRKNGSNYFTAADYRGLLKTYAHCHYRVREDGKRVCWIDENIDPFTGDWTSRTILKNWGWPPAKGGYERGKDYNHSTFCDLIISGLCGIRTGSESKLTLHPLIDGRAWKFFRICDLPYRGHMIDVVYDVTEGSTSPGFSIYLDQICKFHSDGLCDAEIPL